MSRDEMIRLARVAGFAIARDDFMLIEMLSDFAALVAAAEREACAKVCEGRLETCAHLRCAAAIRARVK